MFSRLSITNYTLIESLEMEPHPAMNIITGETGAGKSIMLGAVGLLLGNRADTKALYNSDKKCIIEGEFNIADYELQNLFIEQDLDYEPNTVVRREITPSGKSRAFVNDTPVTLDILRLLGSHLMDIHSQHETLLLGTVNYQLQVIDTYAGTAADLEEYTVQYHLYQKAASELQALTTNAERIAQESDYNDFLLKELVEAQLTDGEQENLEEELKLLEHAEEIKAGLNQLLLLVERNDPSALTLLDEARSISRPLSEYSDALQSISKRLNESYVELADLQREIEGQEELLEVDFNRTEEVRERISMLYHLQNKHHVDDVTGLLEIQTKLENETFLANNLEEQIAIAKENLENTKTQVENLGSSLSKKRRSIFNDLEKEITGLLNQLGMPDAKLEIAHKPKGLSITGIDEITILFSANKGVTPAPISKIASGGEFSRLMLCFKYVMASKTSLPTMVFDEIDAGISGEIAVQMGSMLEELSKQHQVITISHLPQIAARGKAHYFVYKDVDNNRSVSRIKKLSEEEKIAEVAKMISGDNPTESAIKSAKELISISS